MKKPNRCLITVTIITVLLSAFVLIALWPHWKKNYDKKLEYMYERQSVAFGMGRENSYKDFSYISKNNMIIKIAAYKNDNENAELTIEDIEDYLSSEHDKFGSPKVLNPPKMIDEFIHWYWSGGDDIYEDYLLGLTHFNIDHEFKYGNDEFSDMDEDLLYQMIEDFNSCPDKESYMDMEKWIEKQDTN